MVAAAAAVVVVVEAEEAAAAAPPFLLAACRCFLVCFLPAGAGASAGAGVGGTAAGESATTAALLDAVGVSTVVDGGGGTGDLSEVETEAFLPLAPFEFMNGGVAVGSGSISSIAKERLGFADDDKTVDEP